MKFLIIGDTHFCYRGPSSRMDDWWGTIVAKFDFILQTAKKHECDAILQPGDFFDSPRVANVVLSTLIGMLREFDRPIFSVMGQHDMMMRSRDDDERTSYGVMVSAGVLRHLDASGRGFGKAALYGSSWGEDAPSVKDKDAYNILVIHAPIGTEKIWNKQELINPDEVSEGLGEFKLIVCGDYHYSFIRGKSTRVINAGALVRKTCSSKDMAHVPKCFVYDTDGGDFVTIDIPHDPPECVFMPVVKGAKSSVNIVSLVEQMRSDVSENLSFRTSFLRYCSDNGVSGDAKNLVLSILQD